MAEIISQSAELSNLFAKWDERLRCRQFRLRRASGPICPGRGSVRPRYIFVGRWLSYKEFLNGQRGGKNDRGCFLILDMPKFFYSTLCNDGYLGKSKSQLVSGLLPLLRKWVG